MNILDVFSSSKEVDDINLLPLNLRQIYIQPHKSLGFDPNSNDIGILRDIFRKGCLQLIPHFVGVGKCKLTEKELNFGYHLIRGNIKGPTQTLVEIMNSSPYLEFHADYILPLLKPIQGGLPCAKEFRGFRMMAVSFREHRQTWTYLGFVAEYTFDVHYVMRGHKTSKTYAQFVELHRELDKELLTVPKLPEYFNESIEEFGIRLAQYLVRIHFTLANKGFFSPRLMKFLDIDFERVQTEEEGAIVALLDTPVLPLNTAWHMVDEGWLHKWRTFVMGRGARRYLPPQPIANEGLLAQLKAGRRDLQTGKEYRCVNYNVWRFYQLVHGGGPSISRCAQDIYSPRALSYPHAAIMLQTRARILCARNKRRLLYMKSLSMSMVAKSVILDAATEDVTERANQLIDDQKKDRHRRALDSAIIFTQSLWRAKKQYIPEANLENKRRDQEVFSNVRKVNKDVPESTADGAVTGDLQSIVHIGNTFVYRRTLFDVEAGLPFTVTRRPGTEEALIEKAADESQFPPLSKILSINSFPTSPLTYEEIKIKLASASFPISLELAKPMDKALVPSIEQIIKMGDKDTNLRYSAFKLMLQAGVHLLKHNSGNRKYHLSVLRISDKDLSYRSAYDYKKKEDDLWNSMSLFRLKFVLFGSESDEVKRKGLNPNYCFEIVCDDRSILFELPSPELQQQLVKREQDVRERKRSQQEKDQTGRGDSSTRRNSFSSAMSFSVSAQSVAPLLSSPSGGGGGFFRKALDTEKASKCTVMVELLRRLTEEIRGSQIFVDKFGMPVRRTKPKFTLKKVEAEAK